MNGIDGAAGGLAACAVGTVIGALLFAIIMAASRLIEIPIERRSSMSKTTTHEAIEEFKGAWYKFVLAVWKSGPEPAIRLATNRLRGFRR